MKFKELLEGIKVIETRGDPDVEVKGISCDSRRVREGDLFVAIKGTETDGHLFLAEASRKGAVAFLVEELREDIKIPWARVSDTREALGVIASKFYGEPSKTLKVVGVSGTNGKTTTTHLVEAILKVKGEKVGLIGTIAYRWGDVQLEATNTTPSSLELQKMMKEMMEAGVEYVVMEVSSHALSQKRLKGCYLDVGVLTNVTPEHLDYHGSFEAYLKAKALLFEEVLRESKESGKDPWAVYNVDDEHVKRVSEGLGFKKLGFGQGGDIRPIEYHCSLDGIRARLKTPFGELKVSSKLVGLHNLYNVMAAVGICLSLGVEGEAIEEGIASLRGVPGRLERVSDRPAVFVDYAHTPDALQKVLLALRPFVRGKLILVFGCGGNRDRAKRPHMGRIASELSTFAVVTSDNPRKEDPLAIIEEIKTGIKPGFPYKAIVDRKEAIFEAIAQAGPEDVVLIAGKGHETYQIIGEQRYPFDDREVARNALRHLGWI